MEEEFEGEHDDFEAQYLGIPVEQEINDLFLKLRRSLKFMGGNNVASDLRS